MSHEPECLIGHQFPNQIVVECYECGRLRAAYQRGAADEREKAGQRVLDTWEAGALLVCEYPHHMLAEAAVAAARGEDAK